MRDLAGTPSAASLRKLSAVSVGLFLAPLVVFAATPRTFAELIYFLVDIINLIIPLLSSVALIIFFWGIFRYITAAGDSEGHEKGRELIIWGVIALFVLFSLWGIIGILSNTFLKTGVGTSDGGSSVLPSYPHGLVAPLTSRATVES